jgi:hypothetical protein
MTTLHDVVRLALLYSNDKGNCHQQCSKNIQEYYILILTEQIMTSPFYQPILNYNCK